MQQLIDAGYEVVAAMFEASWRPTVYLVTGYGITTYVTEDDESAIESLASAPIVTYAPMTVPELREVASTLEIVGRSDMVRDELIDAILEKQVP